MKNIHLAPRLRYLLHKVTTEKSYVTTDSYVTTENSYSMPNLIGLYRDLCIEIKT